MQISKHGESKIAIKMATVDKHVPATKIFAYFAALFSKNKIMKYQ